MAPAPVAAPAPPTPAADAAYRAGLIYAVAAYGLWGFVPIYIKALSAVPAYEFLAQRIVWCVLVLAAVLAVTRRHRQLVVALRTPAVRRWLFVSAMLISSNWLVYIYGVQTGRTLETSFGYFINPLLNALLGVLLYGERLRPWQLVAYGLAGCSVLVLVATADRLPWIAFVLAVTFSLYGAVRKWVPVDAMTGLAVETAFLTPPSLLYLTWLTTQKSLSLGRHGWGIDVMLAASGVVTAVPLFCFGQAARRLPLTTLGFVQYLSPSLQFLVAIVALGEKPERVQLGCFVVIWVALAIYTADVIRHRPRAVIASAPE